MNEGVKIKGRLTITVLDLNGVVKEVIKVDNAVVGVGKGFIANRMVGNATNIMSHMAVGTVDSAPVDSETTLGNEIGRVALDSDDVTDNVITYVATFPAGVGTGSLKEAAIFNAAADGVMLCKTQFSVTKSNTDAIVISWNLDIR